MENPLLNPKVIPKPGITTCLSGLNAVSLEVPVGQVTRFGKTYSVGLWDRNFALLPMSLAVEGVWKTDESGESAIIATFLTDHSRERVTERFVNKDGLWVHSVTPGREQVVFHIDFNGENLTFDVRRERLLSRLNYQPTITLKRMVQDLYTRFLCPSITRFHQLLSEEGLIISKSNLAPMLPTPEWKLQANRDERDKPFPNTTKPHKISYDEYEILSDQVEYGVYLITGSEQFSQLETAVGGFQGGGAECPQSDEDPRKEEYKHRKTSEKGKKKKPEPKGKYKDNKRALHDLGYLPPGVHGKKAISVFIRPSGYISARPISHKTEAYEHLLSEIKKTQINQVLTDNGTEFRGRYNEYLVANGVTPMLSAPYAPWSHGRVEVAVKIIKRYITALLGRMELPNHFWPWVTLGAAEIYNKTPRENAPSPWEQEKREKPERRIIPGDPLIFRDDKDQVCIGAYAGINHFKSGLIIRAKPEDWDNMDLFVFHPKRFNPVILKGGEKAVIWDAVWKAPFNIEQTTLEVKAKKTATESRTNPQTLPTTKRQAFAVHEGEKAYLLEPGYEKEAIWKFTELEKNGNHYKELNKKGNIDPVGKDRIGIEEVKPGLWKAVIPMNQDLYAFAIKTEDVITRPGTAKEVALGQWEDADAKAILKLIDGGVITTEVTRSELDFACSLVMVRNWHLDAEGNVVSQKSRAAADGRFDPRDVTGHMTLPDCTLQRLVLQYGLQYDEIGISDVTAAYPHAEMDERYQVGVRMIKNLPQAVRDRGYIPGKYYRVSKNYYGLKDAGKRWAEYLDRSAEELGWEQKGPGVYVKGSKVWLAYVDDNILAGPDIDQSLAELQVKLKIEECEKLEIGGEIKYVGGNYKRVRSDAIECSVRDYLLAQNIDGNVKDLVRFLNDLKGRTEEKPGVVDMELLKESQKLNGILGWVCRLSYHGSILFSLLSRETHRPTPQLILALKGALEWMKSVKPLLLEALPGDVDIELRLISDASINFAKRQAQLGGMLQVVPVGEPLTSTRNIIGHWSKRAPALHDSSASAELAAMRENVTVHWRAIALAFQLYPTRCRLVIYGDNAAAIQQAITGTARNGMVADDAAAYLYQEARALDAKIQLVGTKEMLADSLTKWLSGNKSIDPVDQVNGLSQ